jgi:hypothetical protein
MRAGYVTRYAQILLLTQMHMQSCDDASPSIEWFSDRAWFDEAIKATKRNHLDNGGCWTKDPYVPGYSRSEGYVTDSYFAYDYSDWTYRRQERERSLELTIGLRGDAAVPTVPLEGLR